MSKYAKSFLQELKIIHWYFSFLSLRYLPKDHSCIGCYWIYQHQTYDWKEAPTKLFGVTLTLNILDHAISWEAEKTVAEYVLSRNLTSSWVHWLLVDWDSVWKLLTRSQIKLLKTWLSDKLEKRIKVRIQSISFFQSKFSLFWLCCQ